MLLAKLPCQPVSPVSRGSPCQEREEVVDGEDRCDDEDKLPLACAVCRDNELREHQRDDEVGFRIEQKQQPPGAETGGRRLYRAIVSTAAVSIRWSRRGRECGSRLIGLSGVSRIFAAGWLGRAESNAPQRKADSGRSL